MNDKKKILLVTRNLVQGGVERSLLNFIEFTKEHFDLEICLLQKTGELLNELDKSIYVYETKGLLRKMGYDGNRSNLKNPIQKIENFFQRATRKLLRATTVGATLPTIFQPKTKMYDAVICFFQEPFCREYVLKKVRAKKKFLIVHGDPTRIEKGDLLPHRFKKFSKVFFVSDSCRRAYIERFKYRKDNTDCLYNFQNIDEIKNLSDAINVKHSNFKIDIVTVSRLSKEKGIDRAILALKKIKEEGYDFLYRIVGSGNVGDELQELVKICNLTNNVYFEGFQQNPYPYIKSADLFLLPSIHEAAPMVYAESMCLGTPILTTKLLSSKELIKEFGFECENSLDGIYDGLKDIFDNEDELQTKRLMLKNYSYPNELVLSKIQSEVEDV